MGTELGPPGAWLAGDELGPFGVVPGSTLPAVGLLILTSCVGVVAARRGAASAGRLAVLIVAMCGLGVVATSRITGIIGTYLVRWWWVLAAAIWLSIVWSVTCLLGAPGRGACCSASRAVATVAMSAVATVRAVPAALPDASHSTAVGALARRAGDRPRPRRRLRRRLDRCRALGSRGDRRLRRARAPRLRRAVLPARAPTFGDWRTARAEDVDATVLVIGSTDAAKASRRPPGCGGGGALRLAGGEDYAVYLDRAR